MRARPSSRAERALREHQQHLEHDRKQHAGGAREDDVALEGEVVVDLRAEAASAGEERERGETDRRRTRDP